MYPARFDYVAPETLEEALSLLAERGSEMRILAGGQSLLPMMKTRLAQPDTLVDINRIPGLGGITRANGQILVGALARHNDVIRSDAAKGNHTVASAAPWIADPIVRNLGTMAGSLAHHDPEGDWASVALATGAELTLTSSTGSRTVPATEFLVDMFTTSIRPDEMVTEVRIPAHSSNGGGNYQKLERKVGDYATVGVATSLELGADGKIAGAGIALTSVYPHNLKATEAEAAMVGQSPSPELFAEAGRLAAEACDPAGDTRGSSEYKRHVVDVFTQRGLAESLVIAQGGGS
ncbi:MAG: xanthine dehydrogenase family protein subunit M [Acidimicrobiia bacterium]